MNSNDPTPNEITRRNFMKKTALTTGAVLLLSHGVGFATTTNSCEMPCGGFTPNGNPTKKFVENGQDVYYWEGTCKCNNQPTSHSAAAWAITVYSNAAQTTAKPSTMFHPNTGHNFCKKNP